MTKMSLPRSLMLLGIMLSPEHLRRYRKTQLSFQFYQQRSLKA